MSAPARINLFIAEATASLHGLGLMPTNLAKRIVGWSRRQTRRGRFLMTARGWKALALHLVLALVLAIPGYGVWYYFIYTPPCTDPTFQAVANSMRNHPGQWTSSRYSNTLQHESGVQVWRAEFSGTVYLDGIYSMPRGCSAAIGQEYSSIIEQRNRARVEQSAQQVREAMQ